MNLYSDFKEIYKDTIKNNDIPINLISTLKTVAIILVCVMFLLEKCGLRTFIPLNENIVFPEFLYSFLSKKTLKMYVALLLYYYLLRTLVRRLLTKFVGKVFFYTVEDLYIICTYLIVVLNLVKDVYVCLRGTDVLIGKNIIMYILLFCGAVLRFIAMVYVYNDNLDYFRNIKYTSYFDSNGKRIAQSDRVVYRGRLYNVTKINDEWSLSKKDSGYLKQDVKLDDAVIDKEGKIQIFYLGMGERTIEEPF